MKDHVFRHITPYKPVETSEHCSEFSKLLPNHTALCARGQCIKTKYLAHFMCNHLFDTQLL